MLKSWVQSVKTDAQTLATAYYRLFKYVNGAETKNPMKMFDKQIA